MPPLSSKIRVLIVDDSIFFRKSLEKGLSANPRIEIVGMAADAMEAMDQIQALQPDVVTLDVEMPKLSGIDFLKKLIPLHPVPVIVVSAMHIRMLDALDAGAVDFVRKPDFHSSQGFQAFVGDLAVKIEIASISRVHARPAATDTPAPLVLHPTGAGGGTVIAIGASTGGTEAILAVVRDLPPSTPGILVVQHMPPIFTKMYAERLDKVCRMRVTEAVHRERVEPGKIIIGAGDFHLRLARDAQGYYVRSQSGPKVSGHCPSVDVLFESVADVAGADAMGILLTGMGADGAGGLLKMRGAGAYTVGQDEESCVVYGMPQVAYNSGAVAAQLPLSSIGSEIVRYLNSKRR